MFSRVSRRLFVSSSSSFRSFTSARSLVTRPALRYALAASAVAAFTAVYVSSSSSLSSSPSSSSRLDSHGQPYYSLSEIAQHNHASKGIWVVYKDGVYDITNFISQHPGGKQKISMAAGGSIEPFWSIYQQHNTEHVKKILNELRIGSVEGYEEKQASASSSSSLSSSDPYSQDPHHERHPSLIAASPKPFNAEPPSVILSSSFITPTDLFFVRNHLPVPLISNGEEFMIEITGEGIRPLKLSVQELKSLFARTSVVSTLQCAGNRRFELHEIKPIKGLGWSVGAISNAKWTGARLRDVLNYAGVKDEAIQSQGIQHVQFEGADHDPMGTHYGSSITINKALDPDTLLAYEMNDQPLTRDHGYPVRAIVPGIVAARQVKWINKIILSHEESKSHWQKNDYKSFSPGVDWNNVNFDHAPAIQEMPVQSAICDPPNNSNIDLDTDELKISGYAWSGGGRGIVRVDLSTDGGKSWQVAQLHRPDGTDFNSAAFQGNRIWSWTPFDAVVKLDTNKKEQEIICRAVDSSYNSQPDTLQAQWNLRGVVNNAWHRVKIHRKAEEEEQ
jgi:sulfite oxidase